MLFALPLSGLSVLFLVSTALLLSIAGLVWRSRTETRVTDWFLMVLVSDAAWAFTSVIPLEAGTVAVAFAGEVSVVVARSLAALAWFVFSLTYTGRANVLTRRRLLVVALPLALSVVAFATGPFHPAMVNDLAISVRPTATLVTYEYGPLSVLATVYALLLVLTGAGLVAWTALTDPELYADQTVGLLAGAMMPIAGAALTVAGVYTVGTTNLTPATLSVTAVGYGYALFRTDLLETGPAVAARGQDVAIERLSEGFLVVDGRGVVVEANTAAEDLLNRSGLTNRPAGVVLGTDRSLTSGQHLLRTDDGTVLEAQVTPIDDAASAASQVVTLRDVTARQRRQQRLQVLNRVLRHNVRNDLDVVRGYAERIADGDTGGVDISTAADQIKRNADSLLSTAEKARTVEQLLGETHDPRRESVELSALLSERVAAVRADRVGTDIRLELPEECPLRSNRDVLRTVVDELLDNAVCHTGPETTVWVRLSADDDVRVEIADDGPGIPDQERRAVLRGTEHALDHASHFGLWMVRWGIQYLGGDLSIRDRSPTGTVVELRLPR